MAMLQRGSSAMTRRFGLTAEPNVIPFIDVLLVLLIIFMVTAPIPTVDIRVDMPPSHSVYTPLRDQRPTIISLREGETGLALFVDEEAVHLSQLGARAAAHAVRNNPGIEAGDVYAQARLFLRADQSTAYRNVVDVMSQLQEDGFAQVNIFAEQAAEG